MRLASSNHQCLRASLYSFRVDLDLNCIKGGGGCHLREKVLAEAADTYVKNAKYASMRSATHDMDSFILVADYRKNSSVLGTMVSKTCHLSPYPSR